MRRVTRRRLISATVATLVLLTFAEALSWVWPAPDPSEAPVVPPEQQAIMLHGNPMLLWELVPGKRQERGVEVNVNRRGFRGPERGPRRGPRALAVGDSSIYGFGVADDEVWTAKAEAMLGAEVINGACPGWSSFQSLNMLNMRGMAYEPDLLIVGNLWSDNNYDGFVDRQLLASYAGWEASWVRDARVLLERSQLFRRLDWQLRVLPQATRAKEIGWDLSDSDARSGLRRVAIEDYTANLEAMASVMRRRGGGVAFLLLANRDDLTAADRVYAWEPYRQVMRAMAARHGAPLVDVPSVFRSSGHSVDALFLDKMHPTALGHGLIADAMANALRAVGWPAAPFALASPRGAMPSIRDRFANAGGLPVEGGPTAP